MKGIHQLYVTDSLLYVLDIDEHKVHIFTRQGKHLRTIYDRGQGPNEYISINVFTVDPYNERILLSDSFSKRILTYDLLGNFLSTIQLGFSPIVIAGRANGGFVNLYEGSNLCYDNKEMENHHIHLLDSTGKVTDTFLDDETKEVLNIMSASSINYLPNNSILYAPMLSDTIYRIDLSGFFAPQYVFCNHSSFKLPDREERQEIGYTYEDPASFIECEKKGYLLSWGGFVNADEQMLFVFGWENFVYLLYSKESGRSLTLLAECIEESDNEITRIILSKFPKTSHKGWFYTSIDAITANMIVPSLTDSLLKKQLQCIDADDNPAVIRYKLNI